MLYVAAVRPSRCYSGRPRIQQATTRRSVLAKHVVIGTNMRGPFRLAAAAPDTDVRAKDFALVPASILTAFVALRGASYVTVLREIPEPYKILTDLFIATLAAFVPVIIYHAFQKAAAEAKAVTVSIMEGSTELRSTSFPVGELVKGTEGKAEMLSDCITRKCGCMIPEGSTVAAVKLVGRDGEVTLWAHGKDMGGVRFMCDVQTAVLLSTFRKIILQIEQVKV